MHDTYRQLRLSVGPRCDHDVTSHMPRYSRQRLTKTQLDTAAPGPADYTLWDADVPGLGLRVRASGSKAWVFRYSAAGGRWRQASLGGYPSLLLKAAQERARTLAAGVRSGDDPLEAKQARRAAVTVSDLLDRYLESEAFTGNAASTRANDAALVEHHIRPVLGRRLAGSITREDVLRLRRKVASGEVAQPTGPTKLRGRRRLVGGEGVAGKVVVRVSVVFAWAIAQGLDPAIKGNPTQGVPGPAPGRRVIAAEPGMHQALRQAITDLETERAIQEQAADALRLILWTGLRRGEAQALRWRQVDLEARELTFTRHEHKSGHRTQRPKTIALPAPAAEILATRTRGEPEDRVFPPLRGDQIRLDHPWRKVRERAGLPGLVLHGLRHLVGSALAQAGAGPAIIAAALGHAQVSTAERYIATGQATRRATADLLTRAIEGGNHD